MSSLLSSGSDRLQPSTRFDGRTLAAMLTQERGLAWTMLMASLSLAQVWPILMATHLPFQDLPQHLAAIRVLREQLDHGAGPYFDVDLLRTQYLAYYGAAVLLSYPFGVVLANKLLLATSLVAVPWSLWHLLRVLGRDPRLSVFAFGLTYNAHVMLGFANFTAAIPLLFAGLAQAVALRTNPTRPRQAAFVGLLLLCFYTHVLPFAFLCLGSAFVLRKQGGLATVRRAYVFVPATVAAGLWLGTAPAGRNVWAALRGDLANRATFASFDTALRELPMWLTDVLHTQADQHLLLAWGLLFGVALVIGIALRHTVGSAARGARPAADDVGFRLALLSPIAGLAYFLSPTGIDWIWPISARFPLLALLFAILWLPRLRGVLGASVVGAAAVIALLSFGVVGRAFAAFERDEVGEVDAALEVIPEGERVAGLIFEPGSRNVRFSPFLHYVALYQAHKGGAVMFTFADFPHSPFAFRVDARPPRVAPRWEWLPARVNPARDLAWYRYVLVRGGPGRIQRSARFENVFRGPLWSVWRQRVTHEQP